MACVSGLTNGNFSYMDCCGGLNQGSSLNEVVCIDYNYVGSAFGISDIGQPGTCDSDCGENVLDYVFSVTGICNNNTGTVIITPSGGVGPYTISHVLYGLLVPNSGTTTNVNESITFTGLTGGTHVFVLNDTLTNQNTQVFINVAITGCYVANIGDVIPTTCGFSNGSLTISTSTNNPPYSILFYEGTTLIDATVTNVMPYTYGGLSGGTYYASLTDSGGVTAKTESVLISPTTPLTFGLWKVNTSTCNTTSGKLAVTGITGVGPYTYLWSNGQTTQSITGLTAGVYSCVVTDNYNGCFLSKIETITENSPLGVSSLVANQPTCFNSDGSLTYTISGGSSPLYYSATTAQQGYTLSNTFTITGLSSGNISVSVTDASQCTSIFGGFISVPNGFWDVAVVVTNSNCDQNNGSVFVSLEGLAQTYTYTLAGQNTNTTYQYNTTNFLHTFPSLPNDTYILTINGSGTNCVYTSNPPIVINSSDKFNVNISTTGSTCGLANGGVEITVSTGYTLPIDYIISNGNASMDTFMSAYTITDLASGSYTVTVNDADGCQVVKPFVIINGTLLSTSITTTNCSSNGSNGTAKVVIYDGEPPFTYLWSNSQTGMTATGLTANTYSVTITDSVGCINIQNATITCLGTVVSGYSNNNFCSTTFTTISQNKRGFSQMLNEGFYDATIGIGSGNTLSNPVHTDCVFSSATFNCVIDISGITYSGTFYTATTINDVPQYTLWQSTIEGILSGIPYIQSYSLDLLANTLKITAYCDNPSYESLSDAPFSLSLEINYEIYCRT